MENKTTLSVRDMAYIAMFAVIMAVCSWISVPYVAPFTLQTFGVFLAVGVLGGKRGTLAVLVYILLGCVGLPVFAGFTGGIGILLGSTGGYIVGFVFLALVMWAMERWAEDKTWRVVLSMVLSQMVGPVGIWMSWPIGWVVSAGMSLVFYRRIWQKNQVVSV